MAIRGTVTELVDLIRTNFNEKNWKSHTLPGPTCAMGWRKTSSKNEEKQSRPHLRASVG